MNEMLRYVVDGMSQQSVQITAVFVIVAGMVWLLRNRSAHWRYMLWLVVLIKCITPPVLSVPLAILPADALPAKTTPAQQKNVPSMTERSPTAVSSIAPKWTVVEPSVEIKGTQHPGTAKSLKPIARFEPVALAPAERSVAPSPTVPPSTIITKSAHNPVWGAGQWIGLAWILGFAGFGLFVLVRGWQIHTHLRHQRKPVDEKLQQEIAALAKTMGLKRCPKAWLVEKNTQPFVWGLWRGSLFLPADFGELTLDARRQILAHELAHIVRCDAAVNALQILAQGLFFFHPLVWWANRQLRREREKCCDEIAIATRIVQPRQYTTAIVDALLRDRGPQRAMSSLAVAGPVKNLEERIKTILTPGKQFFRRPTWSAIVMVLLLAIVVAPTALTLTARAEENKTADTTKAKEPEQGDQAKATQYSPPKVILPNGVSVELLAVNHHPAKPTGWWRPDGKIISNETFKTQGGSISPSKLTDEYELIFKVDAGDKTDIAAEFQSENDGSWVCMEAPDHRNYKVYAVQFPNIQTSCSTLIGIASGEWHMAKNFDPTAHSSGTRGNHGYAFSGAIQSGADLVVTVSENLKETINRRVVAIDKQGKLHPAVRTLICSMARAHQTTATFDNLKKEDVKEFQFQVRHYEWALFQHISLQLGGLQNVIACRGKEGRFTPEKKAPSAKSVKMKIPAEEEAAVRAKLQKRIPKIELSDVHFSDAMEYLREVSNMNLFVNFGQINEKYNTPVTQENSRMAMYPGMESFEPVSVRSTSRRGRTGTAPKTKKQNDARKIQISMNLKDVTVEDALRRILDAASGATGIQLGYAIDGSTLIISTREGISAMTPRLSPASLPKNEKDVKHTLDILQKRCVKAELMDVRFQDAMGYFREMSNLNVFTNYNQIDREWQKHSGSRVGKCREVQIQINLTDVTLEDVLRRFLDSAGGEMGVPLGYTIDGSTLVVSTRKGIQSMIPRLAPAEEKSKSETLSTDTTTPNRRSSDPRIRKLRR